MKLPRPDDSALYGVGFRTPHYDWVTTQQPRGVEFFEVISDNFMGVGGRPRSYLEKLRETYAVTMHGVSLSIGSLKGLDIAYLKGLKELAQFLDAPYVSDHLSWGHFETYATHDLLPIVYTKANLQLLSERLDFIQNFLGRRFYLENPSAYVAYQAGDFSEGEFFRELLTSSGAGILLDINNLYVNQTNLGQDPLPFLYSLRSDDIAYFHLAGHSNEGAVLVDTHDHPVADPVWELFARAKALFPEKSALIEWDGNIPEFSILEAECQKAKHLAPLHGSENPHAKSPKMESRDEISSQRIYRIFYEELIRPYGVSEKSTEILAQDKPTPAAVGMKVYNHAYFSRLNEVLRENFPALFFLSGAKAFDLLTVEYLQAMPPQGHSLDAVGEGLVNFLANEHFPISLDLGVARAAIADLARLEWAQCLVSNAQDEMSLNEIDLSQLTADDWDTTIFQLIDAIELVEVQYSMLSVMHAALRGEAPDRPEFQPELYLIYRDQAGTWEDLVKETSETMAYPLLKRGAKFIELVDCFTEKPGFIEAECMQRAAAFLMQVARAGHLRRVKNANRDSVTVPSELYNEP